METGEYRPIRPSKNCISNAMNVGHPSNLARVFALYGGEMDETGVVRAQPDLSAMRRDLYAVSISDEETRQTIKDIYRDHGVILEPHGAVGWAGLVRYLKEVDDGSPCFSLETADPAKFPDEIISLIGINPKVPEAMSKLDRLEEHYDRLDGSYTALKRYLISVLPKSKVLSR
jgi:threonine synthase